MSSPATPQPSAMCLHIHLTDGSVQSFVQEDEVIARDIWERVNPARLHTQQRLVIAGTHSKSVFVTAEIVRIDFACRPFDKWDFAEGYADVVELSEEEFQKHAHLDEPALRPEREQVTPAGDLMVSFLKLHLRHSAPVYLMTEFSVKLPSENQLFMRFMLSKMWFHMRLREGGIGMLNLANLAGYTVYPGVAQVPSDAWYAEPITTDSNPTA